MGSIDRADGHLEEAGSWNRACRHIALFLWWAADRDLAAPLTDVAQLRKSPVKYFTKECDGKLHPDDFTDDGAAFADAEYRAYTFAVEAYAKKLGVGDFLIPANKATQTYFFAWLDARLKLWRKRHPVPKAPKKPATPLKLPFLLGRKPQPDPLFGPLLLDPNPQIRADAVQVLVSVRRNWSRLFVPQLRALVELDAQRKRPTLSLGPAFRALGDAQTDEGLKALLSLGKAGFAIPLYRVWWLTALGRYRAPAAKRILQSFAESKDPQLRLAANGGLVRNGDRRALPRLRAFLDGDFEEASDASRDIHFVLNTPFAFTEQQLARLIRWWDKHPDVLLKRLLTLSAPTSR